MSDESNNSKKKTGAFADKGFYIVLFVCVAIIGIASWALLFTGAGIGGSEPAVSVANGKTENPPKNNTNENKNSPRTPQTEQKNDTDNQSNDNAADETMGGVPVGAWEDDFIVDESGEIGDAINSEDNGDGSDDDDELGSEAAEDVQFIWPLSGAIEVAYSMDDLIYDTTMADWRTHNGIDIEAQVGTKVMAVANGTVKSVYTDDMYGTTVVISHGNGLESVYSNMAGMPTVKEGDSVTAGMVIGSVGNTAAAEADEVSHLHFAMKLNGISIDPTDYLPNR